MPAADLGAVRPVAAAARWLGACLAGGLLSAAAQAQTPTNAEPAGDALRLKPSGQLAERLDPAATEEAPTFVSGDRIEGQTESTTTIEGNAELRRHNSVIRARRLQYDSSTGDSQAEGDVMINRNGDRFSGPELRLNTETFKGTFFQPSFELLSNGGQGDASRVDFLDKDNATAYDARYSTCPRTPGADWMPAWMVRASKIEFDNVEETGRATGGVLEFQGVPILGAPYLTFPLSDTRKSGFLPPSIGLDNISGLEVTQPYYVNLAPNYDLTLYPTLMSKRGVDLGAEFRYLQPDYNGQIRGSYMPSDTLRNQDRWGYSLQHLQNLAGALNRAGGQGSLGLNLNLNRVSDDDYWRDFPRAISTLTTRLLPSDAVLSGGSGAWSYSAGAYTWQTLQDVASPITPPYDRIPSLVANYGPGEAETGVWQGIKPSVYLEHTRFERDLRFATGQPNGSRSMAIAGLSRRWRSPGWFIQPAARLHLTQYQFDRPLTNGATSASRALPTVSLDSGLVFERDARYFGRNFVQTLEPRAYLTWTPFRDQSLLPNYDSAAVDFNFASIFSDNVFGGNDRVSDSRALTVGVSSRLLDPRDGAEIVRLGLAQRYLLRDQNVFLPGGAPVTERFSDVLLAARVQWNPKWLVDTNFQYNPTIKDSVRTTLLTRYMPGPYRVLSAAYRLQRGSSEQFDVGWQWPLSLPWSDTPDRALPGQALGPGRWYSVGRINYSVPDRKVVDLVAGFEYDGGCWIGRIVLERLQRSAATAAQRILFQLEFNGFSRLGSSPLQTLKDNVPRYQYLREETLSPPSRFQNYD